MIKFTTVIVTYANRAKFVKRVVDKCINSGCDTFFIIDNGSEKESKASLKELILRNADINFHLICNEKNEGSAYAFSQGMDAVLNEENDNNHILFLDDDNVPEADAIQKSLYIADRADNNNVYFMLRSDRQHYIKYANTLDRTVLIGKQNSFLTFTLGGFIRHIFKKAFRIKQEKNLKKELPEKIELPCGPYGGMLTNKHILSNGIRPFNEMFLYFDDTNYTMDLNKSGVNLWLLPSCMLNDIDTSWTSEKTKSLFSSPLFEASDYKVRYTLRNRVYFELRHLVNCKVTYFSNIFAFMLVQLIKAILSGNLKKYVKLVKYINEGFLFSKIHNK